MLVRVNIGPRAQEIQDIEFTAAKQMLADGRASAVQYDQGTTEAEGVLKLAAAADPASEPETKQPDSSKSAKPAKKK
jgi:hypothetical protein